MEQKKNIDYEGHGFDMSATAGPGRQLLACSEARTSTLARKTTRLPPSAKLEAAGWRPREVEGVEENIKFKMPRELASFEQGN